MAKNTLHVAAFAKNQRNDVDAIALYIAEDSPSAAERFFDAPLPRTFW